MKLIVGLGNPGAEYAHNRHNVGFMAIDAIAELHGFGPWKNKFQGQIADGKLGSEKCLLLKPSTYMNESGRSAAEAARFYKIDIDDVIVLHDELDLASCKVRVKSGGGVAGHNGLKSLTQYIGNDYMRVRIGIGHPGDKSKVHSHVLKDFSRGEMESIAPLLDAIATAAPKLVSGKESSFMNDVALATGDAKPDAPVKESKKPATKAGNERRPDSPKNNTKNDAAEGSDSPFSRLRKLFGQSDN